MKRGTRIANAYIATTVDGDSINEGIVDAFDDPSIGRAAEDSGEESGEKWNKGFGKKFEGLRGKIGARLNREMGDAGEEAGEVAGDRAGDSLGKRLSAKARDVADRVSQELGDRLASNPEQVRRGVDRAFDDDFAIRIGDRLGASIVGGFEQRLARIGDGDGDSNPLADLFDRLMDDATSPNRRGGSKKKKGFDIGALFGAGSRNNALNLFGKTIGGITKALNGLVSMGQRLGGAFMEGFTSLEKGASFGQKAMAGLSKAGAEGGAAIGSLGAAAAAAGPAIAAAIIVVIAVASTLVSVLGALLALATALTSVIVSGLTAAVLGLAGAFAAAAAAGGLLVLAFMSMTDAQKDLLTSAFQPLKAALTGIGQIMLQEMVPAFQSWANNLRGAIMLVVPVAQVMGKAFADAGNTITAALSGPGFQLLSQAFAVYLPTIVRNLAVAFGALFNGLAATLAALMPTITRFSGYLAAVATRFANWASSAKGQNAIQDFVARAVEAMKSLWGAVREIMGFIADILFDPAVQAQGGSMFDTLRDAFKRFRAAIADGRLEKWMKDAAKFGSALWAVLGAIGNVLEALYNSGVIDAVSNALQYLAWWWNVLAEVLGPVIDTMVGPTVLAFQALVDPIGAVTTALVAMREAAEEAWYWVGKAAKLSPLNVIPGLGGVFGNGGEASQIPSFGSNRNAPQQVIKAGAPLQLKTKNAFAGLNLKLPSWDELVNSGNDALNATSDSAGGYKQPAEYKNPYVAWANSLIKNGPSDAAQIKSLLAKSNRLMLKAFKDARKEMVKALREENKIAAQAIKDAVAADSADSAKSALTDAIQAIADKSKETIAAMKDSAKSVADGLRDSAKSAVDNAQQTLNSAASSLANASSPEAAATALAAVRAAQATVANAERAQTRIGRRADRIVARAAKQAARLKRRTARANAILREQRIQRNEGALNKISDVATPESLAAVGKVQNRTLADFAATRAKVATLLESANAKLADAMALRDDYKKQVEESIKAFGALTTVQARVVDGVEQAITANDIVSNLQDKLAKITAFRAKLQQLLALGLSNSAYKQIVDAGVEGGTAYADALLAGGAGAVDSVNELTGGIDSIAESMGTEIASQMYQAGVDAAQGLVDGLESLSAQLDRAATRLGEAIAAAVKKALGIKSPSRVMAGLMDYVGDGTVQGLDAQHTKVGRAAGRLSDQIAVSPEVASYAAAQGQSPTVSGNGPTHDIDVTIITPTEDPMAVAQEAINEITGRL